MRELQSEGKHATCSGKKEPVIMMYPDGSYDEEEAYVVCYTDDNVEELEHEALTIYISCKCCQDIMKYSEELEKLADRFLRMKGDI